MLVEAGGVELLDQRLRQALLALDLVVIPADDRAERQGGLHRGLSVDVNGEALCGGDLRHRASLQSVVTGASRTHRAHR